MQIINNAAFRILAWIVQNDYERILNCKRPYNEKISSFKQFLEKDNSVYFHIRNLLFLTTEMFKVVKGLRLKIFSPLFQLKEQKNFSFQQKSFFKIPKNKLVRDCFERILYLDQKIGKYWHKKYKSVSLFWNLKSKLNDGIP